MNPLLRIVVLSGFGLTAGLTAHQVLMNKSQFDLAFEKQRENLLSQNDSLIDISYSDTLENTSTLKGLNTAVFGANYDTTSKEYSEIKYRIDSLEQSRTTKSVDISEGLQSRVTTLYEMVQAFKTIKYVDNTKLDSLETKYLPLKKLLSKLDILYSVKNNDSYISYKIAYDLIHETIKPADHEGTCLPIEDVIAGKGGVCRDLVATYYPLLTYYGYESSFKIGAVTDSKNNSGLHIWLNEKVNGKSFAVDPTMYRGLFIPVNKRLEKPSLKLKEKFIIRKKN